MAEYPSWITYAPLDRQWDLVRNGPTSRLCKITDIAIHYTQVPGQPAAGTRAWFNGAPGGPNPDLSAVNQGSGLFGAHFVIDDNFTLALAPDPSYIFYHVTGTPYSKANPNYWNQDRNRFPRGQDGNYYGVGIEHCYTDPTGKFSSAVLQRSHQLVNWLRGKYGNNLSIGRHYDYSGKCCPLWYAPAITGKNTPTRDLIPTGANEMEERRIKDERWRLLLNYYIQSDPAAIPSGLS